MTLPADSIYQNALRNFARLRASANSAWTNKKNQDLLDRNQAYRPLDAANPIQRNNIKEDAAARGMIASTGTRDSLTNYQNDWQTQKDAITRGYNSSQNTSTLQRSQLLQSIQMQQEQALLDMIARRNASRA